MPHGETPKRLVDLVSAKFEPVPSWIAPALLPKGGTLIFGGQTGIGKSCFMLEFARKLAGAGQLFDTNYFTIAEPARILFVEQELGESMLQQRVVQSFVDEPAQVMDNIWYVSKDHRVQLSEPAGRKLVRAWCQSCRPNVLILDPIGKMLGDWDENSNKEIGGGLFAFFDTLKSEFAADGLSIVFSHHFSKPPQDAKVTYDPLDLRNFGGASRFTRDPDTVLTVQRTVVNYGTNANDQTFKWWRTRTRFHKIRAATEPPDMICSVYEQDDGRVRFKNWVQVKEDK